VWDGRDAQNRLVADGAYKFVVQADFVGGMELYDPPVLSGQTAQSGINPMLLTIPSEFRPFENRALDITIPVETRISGPSVNARLDRPARVSVIVRPNAPPGTNDLFTTKAEAQPCIASGQCFVAIDEQPLPPGANIVTFSGRDPNGRPLTGAARIYGTTPTPIQSNAVVVRRSAPTLSGDGNPNVEIVSDPFLIVQTLDQFATIAYCLDRSAIVTMKLLKPGFFDPNVASGVVATFLQDQTQAASNCESGGTPYRQEFRGFALDNPDELQLSEDGPYTFTIEARDPSTPTRRTLYRGALNIFRTTGP
jgi:hypothetical protein